MIRIICAEKRLNTNIRNIAGIGDRRAVKLASIGLYTTEDALLFFPRRYEDRTSVKRIGECSTDESCTVIAKLVSDVEIRRYGASKSLTKAVFRDDTGSMTVVWFNSPYVKNMLKRYGEYALFGRITIYGRSIGMNNPSITEIKDETYSPGVLPIYPIIKSIRQYEIRKVIHKCVEMYTGKLIETLPLSIVEKRGLTDINSAICSIHCPEKPADFESARKRLAYEELFYLQMALLSIKSEKSASFKDRKYAGNSQVYGFIEALPFRLTGSQSNVLKEILDDLDSERVMNRLLQGDVGSGKTVIAAAASLKAALSGMQTAVMVPTSILAMQHFNTFRKMLAGYDIKIDLLFSGIRGNDKKEAAEKIKSGETDIIIGTHSLIRDEISFHDLGLVITDEQHRFGVNQRFRLVSKAVEPDKLVLTATPIPRTLGLIIYGDMDISVIDKLPPGRKKVETYAVDESKRKRIYDFIIKNVRNGRQAYIICPLIDDSEQIEAESVTQYAAKAADHLKDVRIGTLHGKMKSEEKEKVLSDFVKREIEVLVSTTVIEIGIDIPNANIILIENAERYGLAQLHQLRGRVGRGDQQSYCILISEAENDLTKKRIKVLTESNDGFYISEMDMKLRGPGDFFGTAQHGIPEMKIANLYEDICLLKDAQEDINSISAGMIYVSDSEKEVISKIIDGIKENMINA